MQSEGYDRLSKDSQKALEDTIKAIEGSAIEQEKIVSLMLNRLEQNYDKAYGAVQAKVQQTGTVVGNVAKQEIADMEGTLRPLQAWADQVKANEGVLSEFQGHYETVAQNIETATIRWTTTATTRIQEAVGMWSQELDTFKSKYDTMMNNVNPNGKINTSITSTKKVSTSTKDLTDAQKNDILKKMDQYISSRKGATDEQVKTNKDDKLWKYFFDARGVNMSAKDMVHIGNYLKNDLGYEFTFTMPYEATVQKNPEKLTKAMREEILKVLKKSGWDPTSTMSVDKKEYTSSTRLQSNITSTVNSGKNTATAMPAYAVPSEEKSTLTPKQQVINALGKVPSNSELVSYGKMYNVLPSNTASNATLTDKQKDEIYKKIIENLAKDKKGYAKGTTSIPYTGSHWTHSGELLVRKDGAYLTPLSKGDGVIPANLTENLMKWGAIDPSSFLVNMNKVPTANTTQNVTYNNSYDSLLTVNGNVDKDTLPELKEILKQACEYTNKFNAREARKLGRK